MLDRVVIKKHNMWKNEPGYVLLSSCRESMKFSTQHDFRKQNSVTVTFFSIRLRHMKNLTICILSYSYVLIWKRCSNVHYVSTMQKKIHQGNMNVILRLIVKYCIMYVMLLLILRYCNITLYVKYYAIYKKESRKTQTLVNYSTRILIWGLNSSSTMLHKIIHQCKMYAKLEHYHQMYKICLLVQNITWNKCTSTCLRRICGITYCKSCYSLNMLCALSQQLLYTIERHKTLTSNHVNRMLCTCTCISSQLRHITMVLLSRNILGPIHMYIFHTKRERYAHSVFRTTRGKYTDMHVLYEMQYFHCSDICYNVFRTIRGIYTDIHVLYEMQYFHCSIFITKPHV
jgi:hypothetical protein